MLNSNYTGTMGIRRAFETSPDTRTTKSQPKASPSQAAGSTP